MIVLSNEDVEKLVTINDCIDALELVYKDLAEEKALISPRVDSLVPCGRENAHYAFKHMGGTWPRKKIQACWGPYSAG